MINWKQFNPFPLIRESSISLLSDGRLSIKRFLSFVFSICLVYMLWYLTHNIIPKENQDIFRHCFDVLAGLIILLTGAATVKDIIALKNGVKVEQTNITTTPDTTHVSNTITETPTTP